MQDVLIAAAKVLPPILLVYLATRVARRERMRSERANRPVRNWYLALCSLVIVIVFAGSIFNVLGT